MLIHFWKKCMIIKFYQKYPLRWRITRNIYFIGFKSIWTILQIIEQIFIIKKSKWNFDVHENLKSWSNIFFTSKDFASFQWRSYMKMSYMIVNHKEMILLRFNLWRIQFFILYFMILTFVLYHYLCEYSLDSFNVRCFLAKNTTWIWIPFHCIKPLFSYDFRGKDLFKIGSFCFL